MNKRKVEEEISFHEFQRKQITDRVQEKETEEINRQNFKVELEDEEVSQVQVEEEVDGVQREENEDDEESEEDDKDADEEIVSDQLVRDCLARSNLTSPSADSNSVTYRTIKVAALTQFILTLEMSDQVDLAQEQLARSVASFSESLDELRVAVGRLASARVSGG